MPDVRYPFASGTTCGIDAVERFERFLDENHEGIPLSLHKTLVAYHEEIDEEVAKMLEELQTRNDELQAKIEELEREE